MEGERGSGGRDRLGGVSWENPARFVDTEQVAPRPATTAWGMQEVGASRDPEEINLKGPDHEESEPHCGGQLHPGFHVTQATLQFPMLLPQPSQVVVITVTASLGDKGML